MTSFSVGTPGRPDSGAKTPGTDTVANSTPSSASPIGLPENTFPDIASQLPRFYDPDGLPEVHRSLSRLSESLKANREPTTPGPVARFTDDVEDLYDEADELTLTDVHVGDGPFDFEKFLRQLIRK